MNRNFNKKDITLILSKKTGFSANYSNKLINDLVELIISILKENNLILKNLGSFRIIYKKKRIGRNPKTKEEYIISAHKVLSFTVSQNLSKKIKELF